jgi:hypothetical protein
MPATDTVAGGLTDNQERFSRNRANQLPDQGVLLINFTLDLMSVRSTLC